DYDCRYGDFRLSVGFF
nr:immunoglobulin light chain junction region [Macaca mulatta]